MSELKKQNNPPRCPDCGKKMINSYDPITKELSPYIWQTTCGHMKDARLCVG
jgi:hypothetical protein